MVMRGPPAPRDYGQFFLTGSMFRAGCDGPELTTRVEFYTLEFVQAEVLNLVCATLPQCKMASIASTLTHAEITNRTRINRESFTRSTGSPKLTSSSSGVRCCGSRICRDWNR